MVTVPRNLSSDHGPSTFVGSSSSTRRAVYSVGMACGSGPISETRGLASVRATLLLALGAMVVLSCTASATAGGDRRLSQFRSPSRNIECSDVLGPRRMICQTRSPGDVVSVDTRGVVRQENDALDLSGLPILRYGQSTASGPFRCTSRRTGMTCLLRRTGRGFLINRAGFRSVPIRR